MDASEFFKVVSRIGPVDKKFQGCACYGIIKAHQEKTAQTARIKANVLFRPRYGEESLKAAAIRLFSVDISELELLLIWP